MSGSQYGSYATRGGLYGSSGGSLASMPGTPSGTVTPPVVPVKRPVGRPRKTAPAGNPTGPTASQAAAFSTPQASRSSQNVVSSSANARSTSAANNGPIGQTAHPYASAAYNPQRQAGPPKDGTETQYYLIPGPTNRMLLSVRSGVPSQIDWGLGKLVQSSYAFSETVQFEQLHGLYDQLLDFPRRVARAWSGAKASEWAPEYFEVPEAPEMYCPPEGHEEDAYEELGIGAGLSSWDSTDSVKFDPLQVSSHASLLRRALEAGLVLRNLSMMPLNTRWLTQANPQGRQRLNATARVVADVLRIARPTAALPQGTDESGRPLKSQQTRDPFDDSVHLDDASTLEIEGLTELKSYMLDLFESIAPFVTLEKGAPPTFGVALSPRQPQVGAKAKDAFASQRQRTEKLQQHRTAVARDGEKQLVSAADSAFHSLLGLVHHSSDRNLMVSALRCLSALGGYSMRNRSIGFVEREWDVVEAEPAGSGGSGTAYVTKMHQPGLLHLTAMLIPMLHLRRSDPHPTLRTGGTSLTHTALAGLPSNGIAPSVKLDGDTDLGEAALDLFGQLIQIEGNALRLGLAAAQDPEVQSSETGQTTSGSSSISASKAESSASTRKSSDQSSYPGSLFRFLTLLLPFQRVAWLRSSQLVWNPSVLPVQIPSLQRHEASQRAQREQRKRAQRRMLGFREDEESLEERTMRKRLRVWETAELEGLPEPDRATKWMQLVFAIVPNAELTQMEFWQSYQEEFRGSPSEMLNAADLIKQIPLVFPGASAMVVKPAPNAPQRFIIKGIDIRQREEYEVLDVDTNPAARRRYTEQERRNMLYSHVLTHLQPRGLELLRADTGVRSSTESEQSVSGDGEPSYKRIRIDSANQNVTSTGTIDRPGVLYYTVARTPMETSSGTPIGTASISAMILRTMARTASRVLDRAGARPEPPSSIDLVPEGVLLDVSGVDAEQSGNGADGTSSDGDKFGFPGLTIEEAMAPATTVPVNTTKTQHSDKIVAAHDSLLHDIFGYVAASGDGALSAGTSLGMGSESSDEAAAVSAANTIMDGLLSVQEEMISASGENDVLCPALNDALIELRPDGVKSVFSRT
ncbi:hypothetical protein OC861_002930 [Tilletia horrida]|nr:hypothetical protein OC861_002930 [Tilletia horrida]